MVDLKLKLVDEVYEISHKTCTKCKIEKPLDGFYPFPTSRHRSGVTAFCKECQCKKASEWSKNNRTKKNLTSCAWRQKNKDKVKESATKCHLKRTFGLSMDQYNAMFVAQNGQCAICEKQEFHGKKLSVDHDHKTGKIRKLLCTRCNTTLEKLENDKEWTIAALKYLKEYQ